MGKYGIKSVTGHCGGERSAAAPAVGSRNEVNVRLSGSLCGSRRPVA